MLVSDFCKRKLGVAAAAVAEQGGHCGIGPVPSVVMRNLPSLSAYARRLVRRWDGTLA